MGINATQQAAVQKTASDAPDVTLTIGSAGLVVDNCGKGINLSTNLQLSADQTGSGVGSVGSAGIGMLSPLKEGEAFMDFGGFTVNKNDVCNLNIQTNTLGDLILRNGTLVMNGGTLFLSSAVQMTSVSPVPYLTVAPDFTIRMNPGTTLRPFNHHTTAENLLWNPRLELNGGKF